ncbi:MAG: Flp pilus assembly complex ATPase component TadA [Sandaracinaceae bacterium]|nr:Flp pilus assembly complex ATPase component TadA [Sandaracinaceae bacterium]
MVSPTGSGKTTTLACLVDRINRSRACRIITIEDPIEYVHPGCGHRRSAW